MNKLTKLINAYETQDAEQFEVLAVELAPLLLEAVGVLSGIASANLLWLDKLECPRLVAQQKRALAVIEKLNNVKD